MQQIFSNYANSTFTKTLFGAQAIMFPIPLAIECLQMPCLQVEI